MSNRIMIKRQLDHRPSRKVEDIRLAERQYLIQGPVFSEDMAETMTGLWIPMSKEMKERNVGKVLKAGPGCTLANAGEYITFAAITGENFNHLKPQPVYRDYFDDAGLFTLHEENVRAVLPEEEAVPVALLEVTEDGKDSCCEKGGPLRAVDS
jgi:hypothetical protein